MQRLLPIVFFVLASGAASAQDYKAPRTSWGEPDLQGMWANDNEYATPLERPAEFEGKTLADITPAEILAQVRKQATEKMVASWRRARAAPISGGSTISTSRSAPSRG